MTLLDAWLQWQDQHRRVPARPDFPAGVRRDATAVDAPHGACAGIGADAFVPPREGGPTPGQALCASCAVHVECLGYTVADPEIEGVWGDTNERDRRALRQQRAA